MLEIACDNCKQDFWQINDETKCPQCVETEKEVKDKKKKK